MFAFSLSFALAVSAPPEQKYVKLSPNEVLIFEANGAFNVGKAPKLPEGDLRIFEQVAASTCEKGPCPAERVSTNKTVLPIDQERLSFVMTHIGKDTALLIRNGFSKAARYKLLISVNGKVSRTDVCEVFKSGRGSEHWPYKIEWMAVGDVELFDLAERRKPVCE